MSNENKFAVISDIHSNLEALTVVLDDIEKRGIKKIYCLGDIVGYGPNPRECMDLIMQKTELCVMGNHDYAAMYEPTNFNYAAEQASFWTRENLENEEDPEKRAKRWNFLGGLSMKLSIEMELGGEKANIDFVHASPRKPINEYIFPDDVYNVPNKIESLFDRFAHLCFVGHTHVPGVFSSTPDFYTPEEVDWSYEVEPKQKALINVGSVGQPRDRDTRASYVVVNDDAVDFIRVEYDVESVAQKVLSIPELDNYLGQRLKDGR